MPPSLTTALHAVRPAHGSAAASASPRCCGVFTRARRESAVFGEHAVHRAAERGVHFRLGTALVGASERRCRRPSRRHKLRNRQTRRQDLHLLRGSILVVDQRMIHRRDRVLPDQRFLRHKRAEVALDRPHIAVRELEPRAGKPRGRDLPSQSLGLLVAEGVLVALETSCMRLALSRRPLGDAR